MEVVERGGSDVSPVDVTTEDGRLTLTPTGVNTKLNWVRISGTALTAPSITAKVNGTAVATTYNGGAATVDLAASVASDATLASLSYTLDGGAATPYTAPFTVAAVGTHQVVVTATDSAGLTDVESVRIDPKTVDLRLASVPSGLTLSLNTDTGITPFTRRVILRSKSSLAAPPTQTLGGTSYAFASWSDGGAATHDVTATASTTYTATYRGP